MRRRTPVPAAPITITCPPELAGILTQFSALPQGAARAQAAAGLYAALANSVATRSGYPLTAIQREAYNIIEISGAITIDDIVGQLAKSGYDVDPRTVQRWCADNAGRPGPLRLAGVRTAKGRGCFLPIELGALPPKPATRYKPHPADVLILGLIELEGPQIRDSIVGQLEGESYKSRGKEKTLGASTVKHRVATLVTSGVLTSTAAGYIIANETASREIQSVEFFK